MASVVAIRSCKFDALSLAASLGERDERVAAEGDALALRPNHEHESFRAPTETRTANSARVPSTNCFCPLSGGESFWMVMSDSFMGLGSRLIPGSDKAHQEAEYGGLR